MKSSDERKAEFERREAERKEKYRERMDALRVKNEARASKIDAWVSKGAPAVEVDAPPSVYVPSLLGSVAGAVIPGVAIFQAVKSDRSAKAVRDAMTTEQQAAARRFPMGQGGG